METRCFWFVVDISKVYNETIDSHAWRLPYNVRKTHGVGTIHVHRIGESVVHQTVHTKICTGNDDRSNLTMRIPLWFVHQEQVPCTKTDVGFVHKLTVTAAVSTQLMTMLLKKFEP